MPMARVPCEVKVISPVYVPAASVPGAMIVAVIEAGVRQKLPHDVLCNQLPPFPVRVTESNVKFVPVLATVNVWGGGFTAENWRENCKPCTWTKTLFPIITLTGIVTLLPLACNESRPTNVPATNPPPGRF